MELLKQTDVSNLVDTSTDGMVQQILHSAGWKWYNANKEDKIVTLWIFKTVRVKDIRFLFVRLFGEE